MTNRLRLSLLLVSLVFVVSHVRALPQTLEDIDSINFALGVEHFDVAAHQPHPPGYPLYIAAARASTYVIGLVRPSWDRDRRAAAGLALLGLIAGAIAVWVFAEFWMAIGLSPVVAASAAALAVASPLFWFTAARPMTDVPGVVAAVAVQAAFLRALRRRDESAPGVASIWIWSSFAAGVLIGFRSQALWLTGPLMAWCIGDLLVRRRWRVALTSVSAGAIGVLVWAVPLVWLSGGWSQYMAAVWFQGSQDLTGIELLSTKPSMALLRKALVWTFLQPWIWPVLAKTVLVLASFGIVWLAVHGRRTLAMLVVAFWPYLVFHLAFQETVTIRYALPLVIPMCGFAVLAAAWFGQRTAAWVAAILVAASLVAVEPRVEAYARDGAPVFRAFQDMQRALPSAGASPDLRMHHQVWWGIRRTMEWYRPVWDVGAKPHPGDREWLDVVRHWASGETRPIWFLGDLSRTDQVLFDPRATHLGGRYELPASIRDLIQPRPRDAMPDAAGIRLDSLNWWRMDRPGWMLGRGWSLTPEISGVTAADHAEPHKKPAEGFILRQAKPLRILIGGRYLRGNGPASITVDLDATRIAEFTVDGATPWFVQWIDLPNGVPEGAGAYAPLMVQVTSTDAARPSPEIGLEQFDAAFDENLICSLASGWNEPEGDPKTGQLWHWTTARSTIECRGTARDATLTISGADPLRDFPRSPVVVVRAGDRELTRFSPASAFSRRVSIPADAFHADEGRITIETDLTFSPSEREAASRDVRRLGLRLFESAIR